MATADAITRAYQGRLRALRASIEARLLAYYDGTVSPEDLDAAFDQFQPQALTLIAAGQAAAATLAAAYMRALLAIAEHPQPSAIDAQRVVGSNRDGAPLAVALAAVPSMLKAAIGRGKSPAEVIELGRYLVRRTADAEVMAAADAATETAAEEHPNVIAWEGVVSDRACVPCGTNRGRHELAEEFYRHPNCGCVKQWVVA